MRGSAVSQLFMDSYTGRPQGFKPPPRPTPFVAAQLSMREGMTWYSMQHAEQQLRLHPGGLSLVPAWPPADLIPDTFEAQQPLDLHRQASHL